MFNILMSGRKMKKKIIKAILKKWLLGIARMWFVLFSICTVYVIRAREMSGQSRTDHACPNHFYTKINMHARKLGHLSAVYCVSFDRTGNYIFTVSRSICTRFLYANISCILLLASPSMKSINPKYFWSQSVTN